MAGKHLFIGVWVCGNNFCISTRIAQDLLLELGRQCRPPRTSLLMCVHMREHSGAANSRCNDVLGRSLWSKSTGSVSFFVFLLLPRLRGAHSSAVCRRAKHPKSVCEHWQDRWRVCMRAFGRQAPLCRCLGLWQQFLYFNQNRPGSLA